jgi:hypothetical protein
MNQSGLAGAVRQSDSKESSSLAYSPDPAFRTLFSIFTADPDSIGAHLTNHMARLSANDPLLVATGSDIVIFPGSGRPPVVESFRQSTRGFIELTSVSHLGIAVPWILRLRELGDPGWRADAHRLIDQIAEVRAVNTEAHWRDAIAAGAWAGLESKIADLVDYSCAVTSDFLEQGLADETRLTFAYLREHYLDPVGSSDVPVPINDMMAATFALAFLEIGHRIIGWLRAQDLDWERLMAMISGRSGRPTAGLTWPTNNMCHLLWQSSGRRLSPERLYIAPHAPSFVLADLGDEAHLAALEREFRQIWLNTRASVELGRAMFDGYPAFHPMIDTAPVVDAATQAIQELPTVRSPEDRRAIITRLRFVMEDPAQLISNAAAHYVIDQLCACGNRPSEVVIPGFTNTTYPPRHLNRASVR